MNNNNNNNNNNSSSSSSSSNSGGGGEDPKKEKTRQELKVLAEFTTVLQNRVEKIRNEIGNSGAIGMSEKEKQALNSLVNSGNMEAIIAGVATFVFLRRFPVWLRSRALKRAAQQQQQQGGRGSGGGGYTLDAPPFPGAGGGGAGGQQPPINSPFRTRNSNNGNSFQNNYQQQQHGADANPQSGAAEGGGGGIIWRSFGFLIDLTLSGLVGIQVGIYMMDMERMKRTITDIPLLEGQSAISDHFCGVLVEEYKRQYRYNPNNDNNAASSGMAVMSSTNNPKTNNAKPLQPFDRKDILKSPELEPLQVLLGFTKNCMKRQAMERRIRQERGMGSNEKVDIPYPGVLSSSSGWNTAGGFDGNDYDNFFSPNDDSNNQNDFYNNTNDEEWTKDDVSSFVSDQDDNDHNPKK